METETTSLNIAVLIPCYNEEQTVGKVIDDFKRELPDATIYVYDNASDDNTSKVARQHGAQVRFIGRRGKGAVVRYMFREIEADIYVLVDGDDTYPAADVHKLIPYAAEGKADMVVGDRHSSGRYAQENKRLLHNAGNQLVRHIINVLFKCKLKDIMSGYRVFNRAYVKHCPILIDGFELEVMMTLHALDRMFNIKEVSIAYRDRPAGSESKLNTFQDGWRILRAIVWIFKDAKPFIFFLALSLLIGTFAFIAGILTIAGIWPNLYIGAGAASTLLIIATVLLSCGFILDTEVKHVREQYEVDFINKKTG